MPLLRPMRNSPGTLCNNESVTLCGMIGSRGVAMLDKLSCLSLLYSMLCAAATHNQTVPRYAVVDTHRMQAHSALCNTYHRVKLLQVARGLARSSQEGAGPCSSFASCVHRLKQISVSKPKEINHFLPTCKAIHAVG